MKFGDKFSVGGLLISLGIGVGAGIIDGLLARKVRYVYDRWDYQAWAWNKLGLSTYKSDVYQQIYNSKGNYVEDIFNHSEGDPRSLVDITIAGAYNVYIWSL